MSVLRLDPRGTMPTTLECNDTDFGFALDTVDILLGHVADIYAELPSIEEEEETEEMTQIEMNFLNSLPEEFDNQTYSKKAIDLFISKRTAQRYVQNFIKLKKVTKIKHNKYEKSKV